MWTEFVFRQKSKSYSFDQKLFRNTQGLGPEKLINNVQL